MSKMKTFSRHWKSSTKPKKQRKYRHNAPLHIKKNMLAANLSKELRKKFGRRSLPLRKGDRVKILRGEFRKKTGKVEIVERKSLRVYIEGIEETKRDGTKVKTGIHPSNLQIVDLHLEDKKRIKKLGGKKPKP